MPRIGERSVPQQVVIGIQHGGQGGFAEKRPVGKSRTNTTEMGDKWVLHEGDEAQR